MKTATILGARPQFIKAAPVTKVLRDKGHKELLIHTGQHYDDEMSAVFFRDLELPEPDYNLGVGSGPHGRQTGQMLIGIEKVLLAEKPDWVLVYGDTNSTLAGAVAACKLRIHLAHVEAGLRSFNREMPEEHNRVLTDHCSDLLFCPTQTAVNNLAKEGITKGVHLVGDTMYDALLQFIEIARRRSTILHDLELKPKSYLLATVHRPYNTDNPENLCNIINAFIQIQQPIIFPVHPRTRRKIEELNLDYAISQNGNPKLLDPVGYLDMLCLEQNAKMILTDSGGVQKEAYWLKVPCITLRDKTEWIETVKDKWNILVGANPKLIKKAIREFEGKKSADRISPFCNGKTARNIINILLRTK